MSDKIARTASDDLRKENRMTKPIIVKKVAVSIGVAVTSALAVVRGLDSGKLS